jgi:hypothetical protein
LCLDIAIPSLWVEEFTIVSKIIKEEEKEKRKKSVMPFIFNLEI